MSSYLHLYCLFRLQNAHAKMRPKDCVLTSQMVWQMLWYRFGAEGNRFSRMHHTWNGVFSMQIRLTPNRNKNLTWSHQKERQLTYPTNHIPSAHVGLLIEIIKICKNRTLMLSFPFQPPKRQHGKNCAQPRYKGPIENKKKRGWTFLTERTWKGSRVLYIQW